MAKEIVQGNVTNKDATYDHIVKYIGLFGGVQGLNMLIGVIRNKITAFILGPSGIGLINIYNKVTNLVGQATNLGISFSAIKHIAEISDSADSQKRDELIDTVRMWCMMTATLGLLAGLLLSPWISWWTFRNYDYTKAFCLLSLIVAMTAIMGGEVAILKGLKQLKKVALISIFAALGTSLVCIPIYYFIGIKGIVSALVISNAIVLGIHIHYSSIVAPWRKTIVTLKSISSGFPMAKLGIAYILAGVIAQGADFLISTFILKHGSLECVGLYNTGFFLITYIGTLLFSAVEADFFPRLSALVNDTKRMNITINQQIEVCVLLITPCIILEVIAMPLIIRILYTVQFAEAAPMATHAIFYLFFKAMTLPVAYLALAKGDSKTFLIAEMLYSAFIAIAIPFAFSRHGLAGAGTALSLASIFDLLLIYIFYGAKYNFRLALQSATTYILQGLFLGICVYSTTLSQNIAKWTLSVSALVLSLLLSFYLLRRKTSFFSRIFKK